MSESLNLALLLGAAVLLIAVGAVRLSTRVGLPSLLVYLAIGMVLGRSGLGIRFDDVELTRTLGFCALVVIIAEGGLTARWSTLRPVLGVAAVLSTVGVAGSSVTPEATHPWWQDVLLVGYELSVGALVGLAVGLGGRWTLRRAALPSSAVSDRGGRTHRAGLRRRRGPARLRFPRRLRGRGTARPRPTAASPGHSRVCRRPGLAGPDRPVRAARAAGHADPTGRGGGAGDRGRSGAGAGGPAALRGGLRHPVPGGPAGPDVPVLGRPARGGTDRAGHDPALAAGAGGGPALRRGLRTGGDLHAGAGRDAGPGGPVARWLRVTAPAEAAELRVETAPLERMRADLLQLSVPPGSRLAGVHIDELRLPVGAAVTLVLRDGSGFVPGLDTCLRTGDSLLIVATVETRDAAERRLRAVSRRGRLARWFGEYGDDRSE